MTSSRKFKAVDILLLAAAFLPFAACMVLKVLFYPLSEGMTVSGAQIYFTLRMPLQDLPVSETQVVSLAVIIFLFFMCLYLTHGISDRPGTRRQYIAEWMVSACRKLVHENMGERFAGFAPFIAAVMALSACSSLSSLLGIRPPTSDINTVAGWALLVFALITYYKTRAGLGVYLREYTKPMPLLTPMNVISEVVTPVSMAFRHYGNVLSGTVISALLAWLLGSLSTKLLGWLPWIFGQIPFLQVGIPAVLSLYFDLFSGLLQAFIFAMLTMLYISGGFPEREYEKRRAQKQAKKKAKADK